MKALEAIANLSAEQIVEKVKAAGLTEQGAYRENVAGKWETVLSSREEDDGPVRIIAALNNNDTRHVYLSLVKEQTGQLLGGMAAAAKAVGTQDMYLHLPEGGEALKEQVEAAAKEAGIQLTVNLGLVNKRAYSGSPVHHIATMVDLGLLMEDAYTEGTYVAAGTYVHYGPLKKVPYGTKVSELVEDGAGVKAVEIGTKVYGADGLEQTITGETAISGGTVTFISSKECIVAEGEKRLLELRKTSCGKCTFCREGLIQLHTMTKEITEGKGKAEFLDVMEEIAGAMVFSTPCSVGQTGGEYILGTFSCLKDEYEAHIKKKKCPADVCKSFMTIYIDPNACDGCEECADVCPADCIEGKAGYIHMIDEFDCTKCGKCMEVCESDAVIQTTGRVPKLPNRLTKCGKFKKR